LHALTQDFEPLLEEHDRAALDAHAGAIYGIWADFRLAYLNPGWFRFAAENGGEPAISARWGLGASILDAIPSGLRECYRDHYRRCLDSGEIWSHEYECSSDLSYRRLHQVVYPLGGGDGLLVSNAVRVERGHDSALRPTQLGDDRVYRDRDGIVHQCAICRRVKNLREPERWDWVPEWVRRMPEFSSHGYCPACFGDFFRLPQGDRH